jgi:hypothetical protein
VIGHSLPSLLKMSARQVIQRLCAFEDAVSTAALGVDNSLGDSLSVEVGEEID